MSDSSVSGTLTLLGGNISATRSSSLLLSLNLHAEGIELGYWNVPANHLRLSLLRLP